MKSSYEKKWTEAFAKEVLESIFPDTYKNIILKDKPDLQMGGHGVEVTRAFYANQSEVIHLYDFIENQTYNVSNEKQMQIIKRIEQLGATLLIDDSSGRIHGIMPFENGVQIDGQPIQHAIYFKSKKLDSYFESGFAVVDLFVFAPEPGWFEREHIKECFDTIDIEFGYGTIFVYSNKTIFSYNKGNKELYKYLVPEDVYLQCSKKAEKYANRE